MPHHYICIRTFKVPGFELVEINVAYNIHLNGLVRNFLAQVIIEKLLICGMKSKTRRDGYCMSIACRHIQAPLVIYLVCMLLLNL